MLQVIIVVGLREFLAQLMSESHKESHLRSILKGLTWRIIATSTIFGITYFTTGEMETAVKVASIEFFNEQELLGQSNDPHSLYVNEIMPRKLELNLKYIRHMNFLTDCKIIVKTLSKIF